jgi:hypothetical protein
MVFILAFPQDVLLLCTSRRLWPYFHLGIVEKIILTLCIQTFSIS